MMLQSVFNLPKCFPDLSFNHRLKAAKSVGLRPLKEIKNSFSLLSSIDLKDEKDQITSNVCQ